MSKLGQDIRAWFSAHLRSQAAHPVWAALVVLWCLVCGLFFQVVIQYTAKNELPPGETPMAFFFRGTPWLLPLVLVVLLPQGAAAQLAQRRSDGRLEALQVAGLGQGPLLLGAWLASLLPLAALAAVPLALHLALGGMGGDPGQTLAAALALWCIGAALSALGQCVAAWLPGQQAPALVALGLALCWWIIDLFGHVFPSGGALSWLRAQFPLAPFVHQAASGQFDLGAAAALGSVALILIYTASLGLRRTQLGRWCLPLLLLCCACIGLWPSALRRLPSLDWTLARAHSLAPATTQVLHQLSAQGGVVLTLVATPGMRGNPDHALLLDRIELLGSLVGDLGAPLRRLDPALDPAAALNLGKNLHRDLVRLGEPLLVAQHQGQFESVSAESCLLRDSEDAVVGVQVESMLLRTLNRLVQRRQTKAVLFDQPLSALSPSASGTDASAALLSLSEERGWTVSLSTQWPDLQGVHQLVWLAPRQDVQPEQAQALQQFLRDGGHVFLALDGAVRKPLPRLLSLIQPFGITWDDRLLAAREGKGWLPAASWPQVADEPPLQLVSADGRGIFAPFPQALYTLHSQAGWQTRTLLPMDAGLHRLDADVREEHQDWPHAAVVLSEAPVGGGRIVVCASSAMFSDAHLGTAGNALLALGLFSWLDHPQSQALLPPRSLLASRFHVGAIMQGFLSWGLGAGLPLLALALALYLAWRRRRA